MKIAIIYLGRKGGIPPHVYNLTKHLAMRDVQILLLLSSFVENYTLWLKFKEHAEKNNKDKLRISFIPTYKNIFGFVYKTLNPTTYLKIYRILRSYDPDFIFYPALHFWSPIINALLPDKTIISTIHDPITHIGEQHKVVDLIHRLSMKQSKKVIVHGKKFRDYLLKNENLKDKVLYLPLPVQIETDVIDKESSTNNMPEQLVKVLSKIKNKLVILFFGRILKYKGVEILLQAFKNVKKQINNVTLIIAGEGNIKPYLHILENEKDVIIINRWLQREELPFLFNTADIVVLPYIQASQSGVITLAYHFHKPVIATKVGALDEQIIHGKTGLIVPPNDSESLANACIQLLTNQSLRTKMGNHGYEYLHTDLSWDYFIDNLYKLLTDLKKNL